MSQYFYYRRGSVFRGLNGTKKKKKDRRGASPPLSDILNSLVFFIRLQWLPAAGRRRRWRDSGGRATTSSGKEVFEYRCEEGLLRVVQTEQLVFRLTGVLRGVRWSPLVSLFHCEQLIRKCRVARNHMMHQREAGRRSSKTRGHTHPHTHARLPIRNTYD